MEIDYMTGCAADRPAAAEPVLGLLYESSEWSDFKLAQELAARGCRVRMVDMERPDAVAVALACDALVSRVFASALARGHEASHTHMEAVVRVVEERGIPMVNPPRAHAFEISKRAAAEELARAGVAVPQVLAYGIPDAIEPGLLAFPCVAKPDCGGRSAQTAVLRNEAEVRAFFRAAPAGTVFIVEPYLRSRNGSITRIEIVGGRCAHIQKRSIAPNGLSSYHFGSVYEAYDDCPAAVRDAAERAADALGFALGSFDVIETEEAAVFIDANSVSNVSEDCEDLLGFDLMAEHAAYIATWLGAGR